MNSKLQHRSPRAIPRAFELLKIRLLKFPPTLKCSKTSPSEKIFTFNQSLFMLCKQWYFGVVLSGSFAAKSEILCLKNSSTVKKQEKPKHEII